MPAPLSLRIIFYTWSLGLQHLFSSYGHLLIFLHVPMVTWPSFQVAALFIMRVHIGLLLAHDTHGNDAQTGFLSACISPYLCRFVCVYDRMLTDRFLDFCSGRCTPFILL